MELDIPAPEPGAVRGDDNFSLLPCPYCDLQVVHKLAQLLLAGLATACVDSTAGDPFRKPSSVAIQLRKEMVDYIIQRSETTVATGTDSPLMEEDPNEIVAIFLDDFGSTKRNILSHVSGWLMSSDSREDKIDDFVQEMEMTHFWPLERREAVGQILLRNVDLKTQFHCPDKFGNEERLTEHGAKYCSFRPVSCQNQGCRAKVSACRVEEHDSVCLFKILPCEQHCELSVMRREMDRHCITACPMKLTNCPFYQAGCGSAFPSCNLEIHCAEFLQPHLLKVLEKIHKKAFTAHELKERVLLLEKCDSNGTLVKALDVRSLTNAVSELEKKMNVVDDASS